MRLLGTGAALVLGLVAWSPAGAQPSKVSVVAIVRPSGSAIEQPLIARVEAKLSSRRVDLVHVEELRERIGRIAAGRESTAALELTAGRALELDARFREAAARYALAVRALLDDPRTLADPRRIAETELSRGAALLEEPDEPAGVAAMRAGLGYIQDLQADPTFSPNAREALEKARRLGAVTPELPGRTVLSTAMRARGARFVVYVAMGGAPGARTIRAAVVDGRGATLLDERRPVRSGRERSTALEVADRIAAAIALEVPLPPRPPMVWESPFFWGAVGLAVAGGIGAGLYFTATENVRVEFGR